MNNSANKVVVITGASSGIGQAIALHLANNAFSLVLVARRLDRINALVDQIIQQGGKAIAVKADVTRQEEVQRAIDAAVDAYQRVDVLINNVGGTIWTKPYDQYGEQEIEKEIRRSLFPTLWCCRAVLPFMVKKKKGTIVNVSSIATRSIHRVPYAAAKGGVNALTASIAMEQARNGIRINATAPGGTEAPPRRIPRNQAQPTEQEQAWYQGVIDQTIDSSLMHRYGTIDEQVAPILFLASDESSYITGSIVPVGGGDLG